MYRNEKTLYDLITTICTWVSEGQNQDRGVAVFFAMIIVFGTFVGLVALTYSFIGNVIEKLKRK